MKYKPSTVEQAKFDYSPLGKFFNKGLKEEDKKEGFLKRLKNIEGKNEEQLKAIEGQGKKQLEEIKNIKTDSKSSKMIVFFNGLSSEAKELLDELKEEKNSIDSKGLVCAKSDGTIFNFNIFKSSLDFASSIYDGKITLKEGKNFQYKMFGLLNDLKEYNPTRLDKLKSKKETLNDAVRLYKNRSNVIKAFENGVFPFNYGFQKEKPDMPDKTLPFWVKIKKLRFDIIKNVVQNARKIISKLGHSMLALLILINQTN